MKSKWWLMLGSIFSLIAVDFLAFHDITEPHTVRDWLTLLATIFVFFYFVKELSPKKK